MNKEVLKTALLAGALAFAGSALALPLFGKHKSGGPQTPDGFVPPGRPAPENAAPNVNGGLNAKDAARQAQSLNGGGRVLSVEEANGGWRVKLLKDGNVSFVFVPQ